MRRDRAAWLVIVVLAAIARFVFASAVVGLDAPPKADESDYHGIAVSVLHGDGFASADGRPTARRPPAYPVFLAGLYAATGESPRAARIVQVLLGIGVVVLTGVLAHRFFGASVARVAATLCAINPFLVFISGYLLTENLYLVLMLSALVVARDPTTVGASWRRALATGALLGVATLARPSGLPMFEWTLAAMVLLSRTQWRRRVLRAAMLGAAFALVVLPWYARNASVMGGWVLTTHGGVTFLQGNNENVVEVPEWRGGAAPLYAIPRSDELMHLDEVAADRLAWELGRDYIENHPHDLFGLVGWKMVRFWRLESDMGLSGIRSGWWFDNRSTLGRIAAHIDVGFVYAVCVLPLFAIGLAYTRRRWRELVFVYGVIVVHTAIAAAFFGSLRTRIPVEPVMCVFAAAVVVAWAGRIARGRAMNGV